MVFAKDQPEYRPLPAIVTPQGTLITRWQLSEAEKRKLLNGEDLFLTVLYVLAPCRQCLAAPLLPPVRIEVGPSDWTDL